jgi:hypothetical protein
MPVDSTGAGMTDGSTSVGSPGSAVANAASWALLVAFVSLVLSVAVPAMTNAAEGDVATALLFMLGLVTYLAGSGLALVGSERRGRTVLGALVILVGLILLYGVVPSLAALGVVLLGVAIEVSSLPAD